MFCSDRYAPQSLLLQYVIFTLHFLSIAPYMEPSLFWGLSSDTKGLAAPRQVSTSAALTVSANGETSAEEHRERICVLSPLFLVPFPSVHVCDPSCCLVIPSFGGHSCPLTRSCNPAKRLHFSPVVSEVFQECFKLRCSLKKYSLESLHGV